ncbi:putative bifunctional diguanylate cyclase/phosphodiesterase [Agaribacterium sp. ZY112]|uniref:putative bifunctional diguanylate cyclase/phosphodiesterase n=1 Tax=Agaribacterium sp. ZY112 TaxID=3233574 RepID=UPI0035233666
MLFNAVQSTATLIAIGFASVSFILTVIHLRQTHLHKKKNIKEQDASEKLEDCNLKLSSENRIFKASVESLRTELELLYKKQHKLESQGSSNVDFYRQVFDYSPVFYFTLSNNLRIDDINQSACDRLQYRFADMVHMRFLDLIEPSARQRVAGMLDQIQEGVAKSCRIETILLDQDKQSLHVVLHLHRIKRHFGETIIAYCEDISESRELSQTLAHQAHHDELTGLKNRRALEEYFAEELQNYGEQNQLTLIYFDIDQLKVVNDTCGHSAGDQLIKQLVAVLSPHIKNENAFFARIGGDEFAVLLVNRNPDYAATFAEALRFEAEAFTFRWDGLSFRLSISVGIAISNSRSEEFSSLLSAADAACYSAKEQGRNQVQINARKVDEANSDQQQNMLWVSRLDKAINNNDFVLNFQPIVGIDKPYAPYVHYEVLIQYRDDIGNLVQPSQFLPSAERYGKSPAIDLWVIKQTFSYLRNNPEHVARLGCCSVNISGHTIASDRARETIINMVRAANFPANKVCFEITESSAMQNLNEAIEFMRTLRALGCRFALDDFGTGFSSFSYLKNLDVDYLKIDGSFVQDVVRDNIARAMIQAISAIAKEMGIRTVAEYVENDIVLRELKSLGVDYAQGFGIAKPMPLEALSDFYFDNATADAP